MKDPGKRCPHCRRFRPVSDFGRRRHGDGLQSWCKECQGGRYRRWVEDNRQRMADHMRRATLRQYGLTPYDYRCMYNDQHGACLICGRSDAQLVVDHDHDTGAVRGLLCPLCNTGMGALGDDPARCEQAAQYLRAAADHRRVRSLF